MLRRDDLSIVSCQDSSSLNAWVEKKPEEGNPPSSGNVNPTNEFERESYVTLGTTEVQSSAQKVYLQSDELANSFRRAYWNSPSGK